MTRELELLWKKLDKEYKSLEKKGQVLDNEYKMLETIDEKEKNINKHWMIISKLSQINRTLELILEVNKESRGEECNVSKK